ncbi:MAG: gamma carbonic anhydrase family protein [Bacteroidia bacterium]
MKSLSNDLQIDDTAFIAPNATVIGDVHIGEESSVWYGAVIRGDSDEIRIGKRSNIQDNAVIHIDPDFPVCIGDDCIVGHGAIIHGATLENNVLVGMNAVVLNGAKIGAYCIIGANALVTAGMVIPEGSLVLGSPAKVVKSLTEQQRDGIDENASVYVAKAKEFKQLLKL